MCHENKIQLHIFVLVMIHSCLPFFYSLQIQILYLLYYYFKVVEDEKSAFLATIAICKSTFKLEYLFQSKEQTAFWI